MFISHFFITNFFRLLNFGIVCGLIVYGVKKYGIPALYLLMAKKEAEKEYLLSQQSLFEAKYKELDEQMDHDRTVCENFKIKIDEWKQVSEQEAKKQKQKRAILCGVVHDKQQQKQIMIKQERMKALIAVHVVKQLEQSLVQYFEKDDMGIHYIDDIVQRIHERKL